MTGKHVVVIASGETERRSLPLLLRAFGSEGIEVDDVLHPRAGHALTGPEAARVAIAAWCDRSGRGMAPDKFVVLVDVDGKDPADVVEQVERGLRPRIGAHIPVPVLTTFAQWHLEAWFFADAPSLRAFLGRDLGAIDQSSPDAIANPKLHLKQLLGKPYTARVAEEIARGLNVATIRERSPSFRSFAAALHDGRRGAVVAPPGA